MANDFDGTVSKLSRASAVPVPAVRFRAVVLEGALALLVGAEAESRRHPSTQGRRCEGASLQRVCRRWRPAARAKQRLSVFCAVPPQSAAASQSAGRLSPLYWRLLLSMSKGGQCSNLRSV